MTGEKMTFLDYVKAAFKNQWNLMFLGAAVAFSVVILPYPDAGLMVAAGLEAAYLTTIASNPRFQRSARAHEQFKRSKVAKEKFDVAFNNLSREDKERFSNVREQCRVFGEFDIEEVSDVATNIQTASVNKLLWAYLRLLNAKKMAMSFLYSFNHAEVKRQHKEALSKLSILGDGQDDITVRKRKSLTGTIADIEVRVKNFETSKGNTEVIELELERVEMKIKTLAELAMNRQSPDSITKGVDEIAESVSDTERSLGELRAMSPSAIESEAPDIISGSESERSNRGRTSEMDFLSRIR